MKTEMLWVSAVTGVIAAVLWFIATVIKVDYEDIVKNGFAEAAITENENGREIDQLRIVAENPSKAEKRGHLRLT